MSQNKFLESTVYRVYRCDHCEGIVGFKQKVKHKWKKKCPLCGKYKLYIHSGELKISMMIDINKDKTLGSLAERNRDRKIKAGEHTKGFKEEAGPTPFWRTKKKMDFDILKNPTKYIEKGQL